MFAYLFLGMLAGAIGLAGIIHPNLVLKLAEGGMDSPIAYAVFAAALACGHLVFSSVPAAHLSISSPELGASVFSSADLKARQLSAMAQRLFLESFFASLVIATAAIPLAMFLLPPAYSVIKTAMLPALLAALALFFMSEPDKRNLLAGGAMFALSGVFGIAALGVPYNPDPLFPLLTGLFAVPALLHWGKAENAAVDGSAHIGRGIEGIDFLVCAALGSALGMLSALLPAVSPAIVGAAAFLFLEARPAAFIVVNSSVAMAKTLYDFVGVFAIGKARSAAAAASLEAVRSGLGNWPAMPLVVAAGVVGAAAAIAAVYALSSKTSGLSKTMESLGRFRLHIVAALAVAVFLDAGFFGLLTLSIAAALGTAVHSLGLRRSYLMGALLLPTLLFYSGLQTTATSLLLAG